MTDVLAFDPTRRTNRRLMEDARRLGYLAGTVVDVTFGQGRFWPKELPDNLTAYDLNADRAVHGARDFTRLDLPDNSVDTVVLDPPYKLNGTSTGRGPSALDEDYGVDGPYRPAAQVHALIVAGTREALRVARRYVLVKCADQQSSGHLNQQVALVSACVPPSRVLSPLHMVKTPTWQPGEQRTARMNYSTLVVLRARTRRPYSQPRD